MGAGAKNFSTTSLSSWRFANLESASLIPPVNTMLFVVTDLEMPNYVYEGWKSVCEGGDSVIQRTD